MSGSDSIRDPVVARCPRCQEEISGKASVCPRCRNSALVDLLVSEAVSSSKLRYQAARALIAVRPGLNLATAQAQLSVWNGRVLSGVPPGVAAAGWAALESLGIRSEQVAAAGEPHDRRRVIGSPPAVS
jgi:hypothetical protein